MFFFKQKTAYEMRISDWSSDVCSSDLHDRAQLLGGPALAGAVQRGSDPAVEKLLAQVGVGMAGKTVAELAIGEDLAALGGRGRRIAHRPGKHAIDDLHVAGRNVPRRSRRDAGEERRRGKSQSCSEH